MSSRNITGQRAHVAPFTPLTKEAVASLLGVTPRCIELWVEQGLLPRWRKIGNRCFWHPDVFYAWLDSHLKSQESLPDDDAIERSLLNRASRGRVSGSPVGAANARRMERILKIAVEEAAP